MPRASRGISLTEIIIVMSLAAILVAVGAPVYSNYRRDSRLQEGRNALEAVLAAEQIYYGGASGGPGRNATYVTDHLVPLPEAASHPQKLECDLTSVLTEWDIRVTQADANGFTAVAAGRAGTPAAGLALKLIHTRGGDTRWEER